MNNSEIFSIEYLIGNFSDRVSFLDDRATRREVYPYIHVTRDMLSFLCDLDREIKHYTQSHVVRGGINSVNIKIPYGDDVISINRGYGRTIENIGAMIYVLKGIYERIKKIEDEALEVILLKHHKKTYRKFKPEFNIKGAIVVPTMEGNGLLYNLISLEISEPYNRFLIMDDITSKSEISKFDSLEEALDLCKESPESTVIFASNTKRYPFRETSLPVVNHKYACAYIANSINGNAGLN